MYREAKYPLVKIYNIYISIIPAKVSYYFDRMIVSNAGKERREKEIYLALRKYSIIGITSPISAKSCGAARGGGSHSSRETAVIFLTFGRMT